MSHEHFPGCGHLPEQLSQAEHEHHHDHAHHAGGLVLHETCDCPVHRLEAANPQAYELWQMAENDDDDEVIDPQTGRKVKRSELKAA